MKPVKATLLAMLFLGMSISTIAQHPDILARVKITVPQQPEKRLQLIGLLGLDHFVESNGYIETEITQRELAKLRQSSFRHEVIVENVVADLKRRNDTYNALRAQGLINDDGSPRIAGVQGDQGRVAWEQPGGLLNNIIVKPDAFVVQSTFGGYYSYAQMVTAVVNLYNTYGPSGSNIVDTFHIGTTALGNIIYAVKISDNAGTDETGEPECFFQGVQHAREAIGGSSMIFMMQFLTQRYSQDTRVKELVDNREIYIIPMMNIDGWEYNRSLGAGGGWRKNRRALSGGGTGVDLNRNWSTDWAQCAGAVGETSCGSATKSDETYWGPSAFSEPETQAVRNFIKSKHIVVANDQHSVGPYYSLPYGRPGLHTSDPMTAQETNWYTYITALMGKYNGMRAGNSVQALGYEVAGGVKDWMFRGEIGTGINGGQKVAIMGMTGEGGYGTTTGSTFWPPSSAIINLCKGMLYQNLQMIYSAGSYVDIQDNNDLSIPVGTTGTLSFRLKRLGLDNTPVTVTFVPLINIKGNGSLTATISTLPTFGSNYTGSIGYRLPASITSGQIIKYAWNVSTAGYSFSDTITKIYNANTIFQDNFEGAITDNWTNVNEGTVNSGYGYNYTGGNWVFTSNGVSGNCLSESAWGTDYTAQSIRILQKTANLNLSVNGTSAAFLTFQTRHWAENFHDKLQVVVSTDGTNWDTLAGRTTVDEPGINEETSIDGRHSLTGIEADWVYEQYNLTPYAGQSNLRLKFVFTSDVATTFYASEDEGFMIDNLRVWGSSTPFVILATNFQSINGKLLTDNTVEVKWEATTDQDHSHFVVEKSTDRLNFTSIGQVNANALNRIIDPSPVTGNNFYRVKQVSINGRETYSDIVNVVYNPKVRLVQLYPNPVKDELNVRLKLSNNEAVSLQTFDLGGRKLQEQQVNGSTSVREYRVDAATLPANIYILKIVNSAGEVISTQKFVKQ